MNSVLPKADFVGRKAELAALERQFASEKPALLPVYGRRRVGKTELLLQFAAVKTAVYFMASDKLATPQIVDFVRAAAGWLKMPHLGEAAPATWEAALRLVTGSVPAGRKLVLILDEFQWLCKSSPELPSVLQRLWDLEWQRENRLMLILCGSLIGFMEREVLGAQSPLHGRRTGALRIEPFSFREAALFHPRWSREEQARAHFVCGGVPAYLGRFDPSRSVAQNIVREFFEIDAFFQREPDFLLREELADVKQAAAILETIAGGRRTQGDVARAVGLGTNALVPHLKNLTALGYLERIFPLTAKPPPRPAIQYRVADPLLRFWFRFIEPHWSLLRRHDPRRTFEEIVAPQWVAFCGDGFERLCREAMPFLYEAEGVTGRYQIGEYWDRQTQIDVVGVRTDGWTDIGECKWSGQGAPMAFARELIARAAAYPDRTRMLKCRLFVRTEAKTAPDGVTLHGLRDLYGDR
jgi:AAA+ ATPase superfamily predicted ATPase